ncbi:MAG: lipopolysaccharide biosynthesis protein [Leuconostoc mesenteroides]
MINRTKSARLNVFVSLSSYFIQLLLSMVVRIFFIKKIGTDYLGLNGVLLNTISMVSVVDLGLDTIFVFALFKPLRENDKESIKSILRLYRNTFRSIAATIFLLGVCSTYFLPDILGRKGMELQYVYLIFYIYLANSVLSYLMSYYRAILTANQRGYIVNGVTSGSLILVGVLQLIGLIVFANPVLYVFTLLVGTVLMNLIIMLITIKQYPYLREKSVNQLERGLKVEIFKNSIGGFSGKIGTMVVSGSDNILLSIFTSLSTVGIYSNYVVLTIAVQAIVQKISVSLMPSVGHLGIERNYKKNLDIFLEITFILFTIISLGYGIFVAMLHQFMLFWVGPKYVFPIVTEILIAIVMVLQLVRVPFGIYIDAFGLQWVQRWKSVIEAIANLVFTLTLIHFFHLGVNGILIGTILSTILTVLWIEPLIIYRFPLNRNFKGVGVLFTQFGFILVMQTIFAWYINIKISSSNPIDIATIFSGSLIIWIVLMIVIFYKSSYFEKIKTRIFM